MKKGFTLIELLVVVAIISILAIVVFLTLNPSVLFQQERDATRVSDMGTLNKAVSLYYADAMNNPSTMFMGTSSVIYLSIPDPSATSTAGDQCQGLGLPAAPTGYTYQCASSSTYKNVNGTGWIPINFTTYSAGTVISRLPVDPTNATSTNLYYTYATDGIGGFKVTSVLESQKYQPLMISDGGSDAELYEKGSNLALASGRGLIGYWPMDEGAGSTSTDASGEGNSLAWNGTPSSPNSTYYVAGKVGPYGGYFDGTDNLLFNSNVITASTTNVTMMGWVYWDATAETSAILFYNGNTGANGYGLYIGSGSGGSGNKLAILIGGKSYNALGSLSVMPTGQWEYLAITSSNNNWTLYVNGILSATGSATPNTPSGGTNVGQDFNGILDDVRIYDYALSAAQIQQLYNVEH